MVALSEQFYHNGTPSRLQGTGYGLQGGGESAQFYNVQGLVGNNQRPRIGNFAFRDGDNDGACNAARAWQEGSNTVQVRPNQNLVDASGKGIKGFRDMQRNRITPDGKKVVDVVEVRSPGQTKKFMFAKIAATKRALGAQARVVRRVEATEIATRAGGEPR